VDKELLLAEVTKKCVIEERAFVEEGALPGDGIINRAK